MKASVILCTHNPRPDYLDRTLQALAKQTLPLEDWELIIIDNASDPPVQKYLRPDYAPSTRVIAEPQLGQALARLRGIREPTAPLLIWVDDDNVLAADYVEQALAIAERFPDLGAWSGQLLGEFEKMPAPEMNQYLGGLPVREFSQARWSYRDMEACPFGAGLCVRRPVAERYAEKNISDSTRIFGRAGGSLIAGEDIDLALTSFALGLGIGIFPELKLTHLIPASRVEPDYLIRLNGAGTYALHLAKLVHRLSRPHLGLRRQRARAYTLLESIGLRKKRSYFQRLMERAVLQAEEDFLCLQAGRPLKHRGFY